MFQCFPHRFQQHPLLRIHAFGFPRADIEKGGVKGIYPLDLPDVVHGRRNPPDIRPTHELPSFFG